MNSCAEDAHSDCLRQACGTVHVSYPFALADRPECPRFSRFFTLTCDPVSHKLSLPRLFIRYYNRLTSLIVTNINITSGSLIVDITPFNASLPPSSCHNDTTSSISSLDLPPFPGPFFISSENEFGSFGCTSSNILFNNVLPAEPASLPPSSSPSPSPYPQAHISSPAQAPAPSPDADVPPDDLYGDTTNIDGVGCAVICPDNAGDVSHCGHGRNCCVTGLPPNSKPYWRSAFFEVFQSPWASPGTISCNGGTNYAIFFHRKSSDLDRGIYRLKLVWALPSNYTQNQTELRQSHDYACANKTNLSIENGVPGYRCSCMPGYEGDGYEYGSGCLEINECEDSLDDCVPTSKCENSPLGSYSCKCQGWFHVGDGRKTGSGCQFSQRWIAVFQISAGIVLLGLMMGIFFCLAIWWRERTKKKYFMQHGGLELQEILRSRSGGETRIFKEEELKSATDNYADRMKLGAGGFGTVFKGVFEDGTVVAIKKGNVWKHDEDHREQFLNEMAILVQINHRHVVRLLGCCLETAVPLLVYEFVSNGNLEQNLEGNSGTVVMSWRKRLEVAQQTAEALAYLHAAHSPPILHRDVKPANVLLDENFDAKVADFGLSCLLVDGGVNSPLPGGTMGYLDPESLLTLELSDKSDVYSLGVVLVEIITGRKPVGSRNRDTMLDLQEPSFASLASFFIRHMNEGKLHEIIDARLNVNRGLDAETRSSIMAVAALAHRCLDIQGSRRPFMSHVADKLRHIVQSLHSGSNEHEDEHAPLLVPRSADD